MRKILFFIGGLVSGGKERRFIELLSYLKKHGGYQILVVTTTPEVQFPAFFDLNIPIRQINKKSGIKAASIPFQLRKIALDFKPDVIHTWGRMQTFYAIPIRVLDKIPLINSQITNASPVTSKINQFIDKLNFNYSDCILSNSHAGIEAYQPPEKKTKVIYNGMNLSRFENLPDKTAIKSKYGIITPYLVVMVATFSKNKDYERFFDVAAKVLEKRKDISFVGVGNFHRNSGLYQKCQNIIKAHPQMLMTGGISEVEALVNAADLGVLFSNAKVHGEGISNSVLEYMALEKPVVANDAGGTKEIVKDGVNGFLVKDETTSFLSQKICELIDAPEERERMGKTGKTLVHQDFSIEKMGRNFTILYDRFWEEFIS
jgi:glycosyltransferase involved in cell wall biosynthesis